MCFQHLRASYPSGDKVAFVSLFVFVVLACFHLNLKHAILYIMCGFSFLLNEKAELLPFASKENTHHSPEQTSCKT
jgi:hypothetical protein